MTNNKDYLSQEEIDALLRQSSDDSADDDGSLDMSGDGGGSHLSIDDYLTSLEQDALGEIGNITFGSAATALSTLLGRKVDITTPKVSIIPKKELEEEFPKPHVAVHVKYVDGFQGINLLVIKTADAQVIADLMLGGDGTTPIVELNEIHISAVQEAMNQMMGSSATSMSTIFNRFVNISPPGIDILDVSTGEGTDRLPQDEVLIKISFRLAIGDLIDSSIMQLLPVSFAKDMVNSLMGGASEPEPVQPPLPVKDDPKPQAQVPQQPTAQQPQHQQQPPMDQQPAYQQPPYQQPPYQPQAPYPQQPYHQPYDYSQPPMAPPPPQRNVNVQPVQYTAFGSAVGAHAEEPNLNLLLDIPLKVTVELGRTKKQIKEILELSQGSIIELDKLAGEPVDILVNNKLIAKGEVVVIDENFGVRVTDIVSQMDRIQRMQ